MISYDVLADVILIIHFIFVLGVILPVPLIILGAQFGWEWIRNYRLRVIHLLMIGFVMGETLIGLLCPLTVWEQVLRSKAGSSTYPGSFIGHWVGRILFYDWKPWVFTCVYLSFGAFVIALFMWIPPHRRKRSGT